ncbi:MAG: 23S rRNA (guanosine(2251)-2'-O)-methyltransferase RlmB [Cyclobacteriaceae bacterium]|nr:23S rRNA (guanosine(2251)-2'-O)-methyltransferase RlmB [Cyclobacteriaceae bacterium]MCX7637266.1 23S rRNA (guanosine(2251)-2'-O)-methyltransferase RlmB [Cyclobacteriaceae bacterium]MDW8331277.1 23S rRNA (guanosine(2251)-2'-O)-methyltransferase RlmB [Cyclobacteriaceae bacterium]
MGKPGLIYGTRAVTEAILAGKTLERVYIQQGIRNELVRDLIRLLREKHIPFSQVPAEKLGRLTGKNHQGVAGYLSSVDYASLSNIVQQAFEEGRQPLIVILDRITDVRNLGGIARTAECLGADALVVPEKGSAPISADAVKTSAGALHHLPVCREKNLKQTVQLLKDTGLTVVACTEKASKKIFETDLNRPLALIFGSEEDGISTELLRTADDLIKIPMTGKIQSLNVSVAAGMVLYEVMRQRQSA